MVKAFDAGADGCGELSKILAAITDELWKRGYTDAQLKKIYGGNKMRVFAKVWGETAPAVKAKAPAERKAAFLDFKTRLDAETDPYDPLRRVRRR